MNRPRHVSLRDVTESDLPTFFLDQLDPDAGRMAAFPARNRDAFHSHRARILADADVATKTIVFGGDVAGNVVSWRQDGRRLVGYWFDKGYWDRGVATAALSEFLKELTSGPSMPMWQRTTSARSGSCRNVGSKAPMRRRPVSLIWVSSRRSAWCCQPRPSVPGKRRSRTTICARFRSG